ncbi:MAG: SEC-C domain-containing protein, partial [Candidatus Eremiobacteraeota bacterium]|nr:SEC-C domain-containing protein [Candidatus Eremiobacteraeota bacterium]
ILDDLDQIFPLKSHLTVEDLEKLDRNEMKAQIIAIGMKAYEAKEAEITPEIMRFVESRYIMLPIIDRMWVDHLYVMDALKTGIGLRGYGQKDPRVEYEKEAYEIFEDLKNNIADEAIKTVYHVQIERQEAQPPPTLPVASPPSLEAVPAGQLIAQPAPADNGQSQASALDDAALERMLGPVPGKPAKAQLHTNRDGEEPAKPAARANEKVGRNALCPCGSGKKYKKCHGAAA